MITFKDRAKKNSQVETVVLFGIAVVVAFVIVGIYFSLQKSPLPIPTPSVVTAISPLSGPVGTEIILLGREFSMDANTIKFGEGYIPDVKALDSATLRFTIPISLDVCPPWNKESCTFSTRFITPGTYTISIINTYGTSNSINFNVTSAARKILSSDSVHSFKECVAAGYPVLESFPRQCKTPDGKNFSESFGR